MPLPNKSSQKNKNSNDCSTENTEIGDFNGFVIVLDLVLVLRGAILPPKPERRRQK